MDTHAWYKTQRNKYPRISMRDNHTKTMQNAAPRIHDTKRSAVDTVRLMPHCAHDEAKWNAVAKQNDKKFSNDATLPRRKHGNLIRREQGSSKHELLERSWLAEGVSCQPTLWSSHALATAMHWIWPHRAAASRHLSSHVRPYHSEMNRSTPQHQTEENRHNTVHS